MNNLNQKLLGLILAFSILVASIYFLSDSKVQVYNNMTLFEKPFLDLNGTMYSTELSFFDSQGDLLDVKQIDKIEPGKQSKKLATPKNANYIRVRWAMAPIEKQDEYFIRIPVYSLTGKVYLKEYGTTKIEIENDTQVYQ